MNLSKSIFACAFALLTAASAHATLKEDMSAIGQAFRQISTDMNDPAKNSANAQLASQLATLFRSAQNEVPESIKAMAPADQVAALTEYRALIQKEIGFSLDLQRAFATGNLALAKSILANMNATKKEGHGKFDI